MKDLVSVRDLCRKDIDYLIEKGIELKTNETSHSFNPNKKIASLFFENSTRTRISSETASTDLGFIVNGFSGTEGTSVSKGEPLIDTGKMLEAYNYKMIFMRHGLEGSARYMSENVSIPVINGGDGSNSHPTQTLLDLMTIYEHHKKIDGLTIAMVGDLKYGRTVHSLLEALSIFNCKIILVSPAELNMPKWRVEAYNRRTNRELIEETSLEGVINSIDVLYMTRIQRERFPIGVEGELDFKKVSGVFSLSASKLTDVKKSLSILHPLPRDKNNIEIALDVDSTPYAKYFEQARNGLYMRQAIIQALFDRKLTGNSAKEYKEEAKLVDLPITNGQKMGTKLVYRLHNGTLIDHLENGKGMSVYNALNLNSEFSSEVALSLNINSSKSGKKDVLAIHEKELTPQELYRVGLISRDHTINFIQDKRVVRKTKVNLPSMLEGIICCTNPKCITKEEHKEFAKSKFYIEQHRPLIVRCHYCEKIMKRSEIEITS